MNDVDVYFKMFQEIKELNPEETLQLVKKAKDKETQDFFIMVGDFLLQLKQKQVVERNLF